MTCQKTFHWVYANSPVNPGQEIDSINFEYSLSNGGGGNIIVFFTVNGPIVSSSGLAATFGQAHAAPGVGVQFGGNTATAGATFSTNIVPPSGSGQNNSFEFVQLITQDTLTVLPYADSRYSSEHPQVCTPAATGLDNWYPYPYGTNTSVTDSPSSDPRTPPAEILRDFAATMNLLWDPALPAGCTPAKTSATVLTGVIQAPTNCASIPVALASLQWEFKVCAFDTLNLATGLNLDRRPNGTAYSIVCSQTNPAKPGTKATVLVPSSGNNYAYPQWNSWFVNLQSYNCR